MALVFKTFKKGGDYLKGKRHNPINDGPKYPKGFDITLADVISRYMLTHNQIEKLGEMTAKREIANATYGNNVFYRKATIERLFCDG